MKTNRQHNGVKKNVQNPSAKHFPPLGGVGERIAPGIGTEIAIGLAAGFANGASEFIIDATDGTYDAGIRLQNNKFDRFK